MMQTISADNLICLFLQKCNDSYLYGAPTYTPPCPTTAIFHSHLSLCAARVIGSRQPCEQSNKASHLLTASSFATAAPEIKFKNTS